VKDVSAASAKAKKLYFGLLFDIIGMFSYSIPLIGEFSDLIWAPLSGFLMMWMYKGGKGKIAAIVSVVEELAPGLDVIPSFTLMWFYTYYLDKNADTK
jgi:hypothetical protein